MKTLEQAVEYAKTLSEVDQGKYAVVWSDGFLSQGPYWVVEIGQVPLLVEEGARLVWDATLSEGVLA